jgi:hypothetical protein
MMNVPFDLLFVLFLVYGVLQVADAALTVMILNAGGSETNGVMRWCMQRVGAIPALVLLKVVALAALIYLAYVVLVLWREAAYLMMLVADVFYLYVVSSNVVQYNKTHPLR